ncbi:MAG: outer rane beta-barrel protein [Pseudomonadota bacterium]|nr:outer rane beta-barrel protein [Pseudomonadota bacterium]
MSKHVFLGLLCCSAAALSTGAQAQDSGAGGASAEFNPYVLGAIGSLKLGSPESTGTALDLQGTGSKTAARLGVGLQIHPNFGIEATWFQLPGTTVQAPSGAARYRGSAVTVAVTASLPVHERIETVVRAGAGRSNVDVAVASSTYGSESRKSLVVWGAGARFRLSSALSVTLDYDHLGTVGKYAQGSDVKARMVAVGMQFKF